MSVLGKHLYRDLFAPRRVTRNTKPALAFSGPSRPCPSEFRPRRSHQLKRARDSRICTKFITRTPRPANLHTTIGEPSRPPYSQKGEGGRNSRTTNPPREERPLGAEQLVYKLRFRPHSRRRASIMAARECTSVDPVGAESCSPGAFRVFLSVTLPRPHRISRTITLRSRTIHN